MGYFTFSLSALVLHGVLLFAPPLVGGLPSPLGSVPGEGPVGILGPPDNNNNGSVITEPLLEAGPLFHDAACRLVPSSLETPFNQNRTDSTDYPLTPGIGDSSASAATSPSTLESNKPHCIILVHESLSLPPQANRIWHTYRTSFSPRKRHWLWVSSSLPGFTASISQGADIDQPVNSWYFSQRGQTWNQGKSRWEVRWRFLTGASSDGGWIVVDTRPADAGLWWRGTVAVFEDI